MTREMVITSNGRPVAILAAVSETNLGESLAAFRQVRAVDAVAALQCKSVARGTSSLTDAEVAAEFTERYRSAVDAGDT